MLEIRNLEVSYQNKKTEKKVISRCNLTVKQGEMLAIMGKSGCGKTTLLHTIAGILPFSGTILVDGKTLSPKETKIGLIPQDYGLLPWQTVLKNCLFGIGYQNPKAREEAELLLKRLGILELANQYPTEISGGQAQRVALCRALLLRPQLLLMDEPFSALDEVAAREAEILTAQMWEESNTIGIVITHRLEEALYLANQIVVMSTGEQGTVLHSFENPWKGSMDVTKQEYLELRYQIEQVLMERETT